MIIFLDGPHTEVIINVHRGNYIEYKKPKIVNKTEIMKEKLIAINFKRIHLFDKRFYNFATRE